MPRIPALAVWLWRAHYQPPHTIGSAYLVIPVIWHLQVICLLEQLLDVYVFGALFWMIIYYPLKAVDFVSKSDKLGFKTHFFLLSFPQETVVQIVTFSEAK